MLTRLHRAFLWALWVEEGIGSEKASLARTVLRISNNRPPAEQSLPIALIIVQAHGL